MQPATSRWQETRGEVPPAAAQPLIAELRRRLSDRQLVVISNREPYVHRYAVPPHPGHLGKVMWERPAGGLTAALDPVLQAIHGLWIAWAGGDADGHVVDGHGRVQVPPDAPRYTLRRVFLSEWEVNAYYLGYSNRVLWPACHMLIERMRVRRREWAAYTRVNRKFAEIAAGEAAPGALVWVHDYQLALVPAFLRRLRPDVTIAVFWHIPWPPPAVFQTVPQSVALVRGLLGADLIGFQTPQHLDHFAATAERLGEVVRLPDQDLEVAGRRVRCEAYPISIDYEGFRAMAEPRVDPREVAAADLTDRLDPVDLPLWQGLKAAITERVEAGVAPADIALGVAVDRIDYTKGLPYKLKALDLFFKAHPEYRQRLLFVQVGAPSRMAIRDYQELVQRVRELVLRYNQRHHLGFRHGPILYVDERQEPSTLAKLYRVADFALVNSVQDGMNLVAKEFVAAQVEGTGALILSEGAGAVHELAEAISVNPVDPEGIGAAIFTALTMPEAERRRRMAAMQDHVSRHHIFRWAAQMLTHADRIRGRDGRDGTPATTR